MQLDQDEDDGQMQLIDSFVEAVKQEQLHSSLLLFQGQTYEAFKEAVVSQQAKLKEFLRHEDEETRIIDKNFRYMVYSAQVDKLQYLLKMYLRIRLKKIQLYCFYFMKNLPQAEHLMSLPEIKFLKKYAEMRFDYYKDHVFKNFVRNYRDFKGVEAIFGKTEAQKAEKKIYVQTNQSLIELRAPNGGQYVYAQVLRNPDQLRFGLQIEVSNVDRDQREVIGQGTIIFAPLKLIQERFDPANYRLV